MAILNQKDNVTEYKPVTQGVSNGGLVEKRLTGLLNKNNDYMRTARTKALQGANSRGLLNSSIAVGATHSAAIDAALPIAQQDADSVNKQRLANQDYLNQSRKYNAESKNSINLANTQHANNMEIDQARMDHEKRIEQYKQQNLTHSQFIKGISDINMQDLDPVSKDKAIQSLRDNYFAGNSIAASLVGVEGSGGAVDSGAGVTGVTGVAGANAGQSGDTTATNVAGNTQIDNKANDPNDLLSYESKSEMNATQRYVFEQQYGPNVEPTEVKSISSIQDVVVSKVAQTGLATGRAQIETNIMLAKLLKQAGYKVDYRGTRIVGADADKVVRILQMNDADYVAYPGTGKF